MFARTASLALVCLVTALPGNALATFGALPGARAAFSASGPAGMTIAGTTTEVAVTEDAHGVTVTVTLTHLATGIELRDKHMREKYLETATYPTATLVVPRANLSLPPTGGAIATYAQGTLTLHGQSRPSRFHYAVANDNGTYRVDGELHVDIRDFGMSVPNYMGLAVKPDVAVAVHFSSLDR